MSLTLTAICVAALCLLIAMRIKRTRDQDEIEQHSITLEALHTLLASNHEVLVFDVRRLDLLADPEIIGAKRIPPKDLLENPTLIPKEKDSVVYCTCPNDKTSRVISRRALAMHFLRIKFLNGGLAGWKAKGYPARDTAFSARYSHLAPFSQKAPGGRSDSGRIVGNSFAED
jgi:rhodanese-related sulfurtransferase